MFICTARFVSLASVNSRRKKPESLAKLGRVIRRRRTALCKTQEQLAEIVDFHPNYIGLIERGERSVPIESLVRIAKGLKCRVADIVVDAGL